MRTLRLLLLTVHALLIAEASAQPASKVMVAKIQHRTVPATTELVGSVRPARSSVVSSETSGLVVSLPTREGDYIKAGELICKLNDDTLKLAYEASQNKLASLEAAVEVAKAEVIRWEFEKKRVQQLLRDSHSNAKEVTDTQANYQIATNTLSEAMLNVKEQKAIVKMDGIILDKTHIRAPFDGYVTALHTEKGQWVSDGGSVVDMIDLDTVLVRVRAPESAIGYMNVGDDARVKIDALQAQFKGVVRRIIPQADELARTFPVDIEIENAKHTLRAGLFARVMLKTGATTDAFVVPKDAVVQSNGVDTIWMIQDAGPQGKMAFPINVTLGAEVGEYVAIAAGAVFPEMSVAVRGNERLMPFPAPVQVVDEPALLDNTELGQTSTTQAGDNQG